MKQFLKKEKNQGFALVEMLVTIGIIVIMSSLTMLSSKTVGRPQKLAMASQKLVSDFRSMQSYVLNLRDFNSVFPDGGWGIHISKNEQFYRMFADSGNQYFNDSELYRRVSLSDGLYVESIILDDAIPVDNLSITFEPPDPRVWICYSLSNCSANKAEIKISDTGGAFSRTIIVNKYGLIDIEK